MTDRYSILIYFKSQESRIHLHFEIDKSARVITKNIHHSMNLIEIASVLEEIGYSVWQVLSIIY